MLEMGISEFGEMHRLSEIAKPDIVVITNIGMCHLENLKTRDGILKAKTEIFDYMKEDGIICLNGDDDKLAGIGEAHGIRPHYYGSKPEHEVTAEHVVSKGLFGSDCIMKAGQDSYAVSIPLPGEHMILNALAATTVARELGLTSEEIIRGIAEVKPVGGRSNILCLTDYTVIDDCYNAIRSP